MSDAIYPLLKRDIGQDGFDGQTVKFDALENPVLPGIFNVYVEDVGSSFQWLNTARLKEINVSIKDLHALAVRNLEKKIFESAKVESMGHGISMIVGMETLESSLIFTPIGRSKLGYVDSACLAMIPARDLFMYCGKADKPALQRMKAVAKEAFETASPSRKLTTRPLSLASNGAVKYAENGVSKLVASMIFGRS